MQCQVELQKIGIYLENLCYFAASFHGHINSFPPLYSLWTMTAGKLPNHGVWQLLQEVALLVRRKNTQTISWKSLLQHSLCSVNCAQKNLSRRKCTHLHYSKLFLLAKSIARFCLSKLSLLSEMFMARAKLVWLIHQTRKTFFSLLLSKSSDFWAFSSCVSNKKMRLIKYQVFKLCLLLQEELILGDAVTVYVQVSTDHCLSRHSDLIWQKLTLN